MPKELDEVLLRAAFDAATAAGSLVAELMVTLARRGVLAERDIRDVMVRSAEVMQHSPVLSTQRVAYEAASDVLRRRLPFGAHAPALPEKPLPEED